MAGGLGLRGESGAQAVRGTRLPAPGGMRPFHATGEGEGTLFRGVRCGSREGGPGPLDNR